MVDYLNKFKIELKKRNYAFNTIKIYMAHLRKFLEFAEKTSYIPLNSSVTP